MRKGRERVAVTDSKVCVFEFIAFSWCLMGARNNTATEIDVAGI
ncbi:hypothetical protein BVRB_005680 [Beta vulgaris subsp. vulgaris]|uniref:Uncharacterized protein n=1 Tax=Beta vulgaris subsp. vulgaris TaxID=3555 RepID=A0A0J8B406_BETVV|nr:hypothetical protein BVRB_005680 [Beta vulgaris subsp. vulgaris]